jgi:hypothetical protein
MKTLRLTALRELLKRLVVTVACAAMVACYSLRSIDGSPAELREGLRAGTLVKVGDRLEIRTAAGKRYDLKVVSVGQDAVRGESRVVPIEDIVALQHKELDVGRTVLLTVGVLVVVIGVVAASAEMGPSGGWSFSASGA